MKSSIEKLERQKKKNSRVFKYILIIILSVFLSFVAFLVYFFVKYGPIVLSLYEQRYIYKKVITASVDSSFPVSATIDQVSQISIKKDFQYSVPVKTVVRVPINQTFNVTLDKPLNIPIDHVFHVDEKIDVKTQFPFETKVAIKILGVNTDVPVKGVIPLNMVIPVKHDFHIKDILTVKPQETMALPINSILDVPIDFTLKGNVPVDGTIPAVLKDKFNAEVMLKDRIPVTLEFGSFFTNKKFIRNDNGEKSTSALPKEDVKPQ